MATEVAATVMLRVDLSHLPLIAGGEVLKENLVEKQARMESTWREFLTSEVGLKLRGVAEDQVIVCSHRYVRKAHKKTYGPKGWCANLDEKIADFEAKYKRTCQMYSVRLLSANGGEVVTSTTSPIAMVPAGVQMNVRAGRTYRVPPPPPPPVPIRPRRGRPQTNGSTRGQPPYLKRVAPTFGGGGGDVPPVLTRETSSSSVRGAPVAGGRGNPLMENFMQGLFPPGSIRGRSPFGGVQQQQQRRDDVDMDNDSSDEEDDDGAAGGIEYDAVSDVTALHEEEMELRNDGIQMDFIKAEAVERLSRMENTVLLRARREVESLRQDHRWFKNVKRSPFCCILVEELLRPPRGN